MKPCMKSQYLISNTTWHSKNQKDFQKAAIITYNTITKQCKNRERCKLALNQTTSFGCPLSLSVILSFSNVFLCMGTITRVEWRNALGIFDCSMYQYSLPVTWSNQHLNHPKAAQSDSIEGTQCVVLKQEPNVAVELALQPVVWWT